MEKRQEQARILLEAMPYMKKFRNKTMVIKYGGNAMTTPSLKYAVMEDIFLLQMIGVNVVLVHGGGPDISEHLALNNIQSEFINGLRVTNEAAIEVVSSVLSGQVNKNLVVDLLEIGAKAIGLSGIDGGMIEAKQLSQTLGYVGEITKINCEIINMILQNGFIPVIAPIGVDKKGQKYNVNADTAAVQIAAALRAEKFIMLSDIRGVLQDKEDPETIISAMDATQAKKLIENGTINGGMIPKVEAGLFAMENGLKELTIIDGRVEHSLLLELFSDVGIGTLIHQ